MVISGVRYDFNNNDYGILENSEKTTAIFEKRMEQ